MSSILLEIIKLVLGVGTLMLIYYFTKSMDIVIIYLLFNIMIVLVQIKKVLGDGEEQK
jgi:hypothetical protein